MFEYYENTLCVRANWLDKEGIVTLSNLRKLLEREKVKRSKYGGGLGGYAWYIYDSLPQRFRNIIEHDLQIDPYKEGKTIPFAKYLKADETAAAFFANYELEDGRYLSEVNQAAVNEYTANVVVLNAVHTLHNKVTTANPKINKGELWETFATSISKLSDEIRKRYPFDLPSNPRALRAKYEACILEKKNRRYKVPGMEGLIHPNYCNNHRNKITEEIGDWLMAYKCLPVNYSFRKLQELYNEARLENGWAFLSEGAITNYLMKPENVRIWTLASEGTDEYNKKYGHTLSKDKNRLFPNAHWAIDGTKLDAVHYWDTTSKMAAICKINVVIDVYSEKIIGYSFSQTENHVDHFIALRMAVDEAGARPYLFTYDAQSAHRSKRMQALYSKVIAKGGQHYHHKVGRKSNPIEHVFNRLQQQVIMTRWFSDGQSIKAKQQQSKANMEFIQENKGALPTFEELQKHWELMVLEWNTTTRSLKTEKTRNDFFNEKSTYTQEIHTLERISMFWIDETKPKKYYAHGMPLTVAGEDYLYEVYDANGEIDIEFRRKYVQQKLIVSYDPEYLDDYVSLYKLNEKGEKVFVAFAEKKRTSVEVAILQKPGEYDQVLKDLAVREKEKTRDWNAYMAIVERTGISRDALIEEQNSWVGNNHEFNAKRAALATKEENLQSDSSSLFDKIINQ
jgi:transposase InsO family protein